MTPSLFITKSFVTKLEFVVSDSAQLSATPISHLKTSLHVDVETSSYLNNMYHLVEIHVNISSTDEENTPVYNLVLNYSAIAGTTEVNVGEDVLDEILKMQVPKLLLDDMRSIVYQVTRDAGFPFMMRDDTFDSPIQIDETESPEPSYSENVSDFINALCQDNPDDEDDDEDDDEELFEPDQSIYDPFDAFCQDTPDSPQSEKIDFQWMINFDWANEDPELLKAVQDFWAVYSSHLVEDTFVDYESLPIYKCYYRFFTPIKYHHPDFKECDDSIWPILFQMLYGSFQSECDVDDNMIGLPEIKFTYYSDKERTKYVFMNRTISSLTLEELKELLSDLITEALTNISVSLLEYRNASFMSDENLQDIQLWSELDFYRLFDASVSDEGISLLNTMYKKIEDCSNQTCIYQS